MTPENVVEELARNRDAFKHLLEGVPEPQRAWRPAPDKWNLHEVVCHLYDEEREDFRARVRSTLEDPEREWAGIDPEGWVKSRDYAAKDYATTLSGFLDERDASLVWLRSLENPQVGKCARASADRCHDGEARALQLARA